MNRGPAVLLVRHAQSTWNAEHRWAGQADPPLSAAGREASARLAANLAGSGLTSVASSDLCRASETATILTDHLGLGPVLVDRGLRERRCDAWSGLTSAEIDTRHPGMLSRWRLGDLRELPPPSEPWQAFSSRVLASLIALAAPAGRRLIVAHAGVFRVLESVGAVDRHRRMDNLEGQWLTTVDGRLVDAGSAGQSA